MVITVLALRKNGGFIRSLAVTRQSFTLPIGKASFSGNVLFNFRNLGEQGGRSFLANFELFLHN